MNRGKPVVAPSTVGIETLDDLRKHLQRAIELEHATLPPYLCALYSLDPSRNPEAAQVVGSVFVEEMIHLALAANLLNAVGGHPRLDTPKLLPRYPRPLPHSDRSLALSLVPFGTEALEMFLRLERPAPPTAPAEGNGYETIGQFYSAIEQGVRHLCAELGEREVFCGDPARQVTAGPFHHSGGRLTAVNDLDSALAALEELDRGARADGGRFFVERHRRMLVQHAPASEGQDSRPVEIVMSAGPLGDPEYSRRELVVFARYLTGLLVAVAERTRPLYGGIGVEAVVPVPADLRRGVGTQGVVTDPFFVRRDLLARSDLGSVLAREFRRTVEGPAGTVLASGWPFVGGRPAASDGLPISETWAGGRLLGRVAAHYVLERERDPLNGE